MSWASRVFQENWNLNKVLPYDRYLVEDIPPAQRKQRHYRSVYASDKMKRWYELPEDDLDDDDDSKDDPNVAGRKAECNQLGNN